jgi:hypothetical protein
MNKIAVSLLVGVLSTGICLSQDSTSAQAGASASQNTSVSASRSGAQVDSNTSAAASQETTVAGKNGDATAASQMKAGSTFQAELVKPVDARKNKPGDEVTAKSIQDMKSDGRVILPKGSKIIGHVTEVKQRTKGESESAVGIVFDRALLKGGAQMPMALAIQAVASSQTVTSAAASDESMMANDSTSGMASGSGSATGRGLIGGVASTTGNTVGGTAGTALNTANSVGANAAGSLSSTSHGVVGLPGLALRSAVSDSASAGSVISSKSTNVHLDSGTRMLLIATEK